MTDNNAIQRAFEDIISSTSESIDKTAYKLSAEEKQLVAELLVMRAEEEIINCGVHSTSISIAKKSLALACELVPTNIEIWHERGVALATQDTEEDLLEAITCFEVATKLNENFFEAWYAWASVLTRLGLIHDEVSYLFDANIKYLKAEAVANQEMKDEPDFYWNRGLLLSMIAKYSGEASELSQAIAYFRKAKKLGLEEKDFYNDFAQALVEFGFLINREEYLVEAAELFQSSLPQDIDHDLFSSDEEKEDLANRYFYLANCYYYLFGTHLDHDYFQLAHEAFTNAVTLDPEFYQAWLQMGSLFLLGSKRWQKVDHLRSSVASLAEAYYLAPDDVHVLARLTEALALIGAHEENITCLRQAEMTGHRALILHSDSVDLMTSQAMVSISFGRYFGEESYFLTAKEQAEAGLVVSPTHAPLLHILAQAQFFLSEINEDLLAMDHSLELFEKVSQSDVGRLACFWNEWGIALIHAADITHDKKYLFSAEEKFERAIILQDTVIPEWFFNYGCTLDFLGDITDDEIYYERAIQALHAAVTADPEFIPARSHLACSYMHLGEVMSDIVAFREACHHFQIVVDQDPEDDLAWSEWGLALMHLVELMHEDGIHTNENLLEQAEGHFLQALFLGNSQASYNLACLYSFQGNVSDALFYFERAVVEEMLPPLEIMKNDGWLKNLRNTDYFKEFLLKAPKDEEEADTI